MLLTGQKIIRHCVLARAAVAAARNPFQGGCNSLNGSWRRTIAESCPTFFPMKGGTELNSLAVCTGQDPPTVLASREEYPAWVSTLAEPLPSLANLRRVPNADATEEEILRYLKLTRRLGIRQRNDESTA